jgi:hypothetical protein
MCQKNACHAIRVCLRMVSHKLTLDFHISHQLCNVWTCTIFRQTNIRWLYSPWYCHLVFTLLLSIPTHILPNCGTKHKHRYSRLGWLLTLRSVQPSFSWTWHGIMYHFSYVFLRMTWELYACLTGIFLLFLTHAMRNLEKNRRILGLPGKTSANIFPPVSNAALNCSQDWSGAGFQASKWSMAMLPKNGVGMV